MLPLSCAKQAATVNGVNDGGLRQGRHVRGCSSDRSGYSARLAGGSITCDESVSLSIYDAAGRKGDPRRRLRIKHIDGLFLTMSKTVKVYRM